MPGQTHTEQDPGGQPQDLEGIGGMNILCARGAESAQGVLFLQLCFYQGGFDLWAESGKC